MTGTQQSEETVMGSLQPVLTQYGELIAARRDASEPAWLQAHRADAQSLAANAWAAESDDAHCHGETLREAFVPIGSSSRA